MHKRCNDSEITITFKGIRRDFEGLEDAIASYKAKNSSVSITLKDGGCSTVDDRMDNLKKLFAKMQKETPFEKLKAQELKELFDKATSSDFEIAVVATMSSGKSTLINAMLGNEILPARNEATTATLAKIHDRDGADHFSGKSFDKDGKELAVCNPLTLENMNQLNDNPDTTDIEIEGDIVGISSQSLKLVLTDTPGPNNSRTEKHKEHTYTLLDASYKPMILYVLNATQIGINDDNILLSHVAKAMNSQGRQASDRFIFVLNKADAFDPQKGEDIQKIMAQVNDYLEKHGIHNARIFPAASLMAKVIRQHQNKQPMTETEEDEILPKYNSFIKREYKHFSSFAPLSPSSKKRQEQMLAVAKEKGDGYSEALVYTGIPAIELAISEYLEKYALPAKITEAVNAFKDKIDSLHVEADAKAKIKDNTEELEKFTADLQRLETALKNGEKKDAVREKIESISVGNIIKGKFEHIRGGLMGTFARSTSEMQNKRMHTDAARAYVGTLKGILSDMEATLHVDIESALNDVLKTQTEEAVEEYKKYLGSLVSADDYADPAILLGDLASITVSETLEEYSRMENVKVGEHQEENTNKKWYKPWTWFQDKYYTVEDYENQEFVNFSDYLDNEIQPNIEEAFDTTRELAFTKAKEAEKSFKEFFINKLNEIDEKMKEKAAEMQKTLSDTEKTKAMLEENERNLAWLNQFKQELESLLAI